MSNTLKPTLQCTKAANKAMSALKLLRMAFGHFTRSNFKVLYAIYVRPPLNTAFKIQDHIWLRISRLLKGFKEGRENYFKD